MMSLLVGSALSFLSAYAGARLAVTLPMRSSGGGGGSKGGHGHH